MTFTDDNLKRLKEIDATAMKADDEEAWNEFKSELCKQFPALLACLELSELANEHFLEHDPECEVCLAHIKAWCKVAGK